MNIEFNKTLLTYNKMILPLLPYEIISKILLYNSHPVADIIKSYHLEITLFKTKLNDSIDSIQKTREYSIKKKIVRDIIDSIINNKLIFNYFNLSRCRVSLISKLRIFYHRETDIDRICHFIFTIFK